MGYLRPVARFTGMSSWANHQRRTTPSTEPGTDYYCPIGTPVVAPADGRVWMTGDSIIPATGRFVALAFDDGRGGRALHLSRRVVSFGQRVKRGQVIGYSGATGYGKEDWSSDPSTGGAHVHWTLWPTQVMRFGYTTVNGQRVPYTIDHEKHIDTTGVPAGEEDDMPTAEEIAEAVWAKQISRGVGGTQKESALQALANVSGQVAGVPDAVWARTVSRDNGKVLVPALQELADAKSGTIRLEAQVAALTELVKQISVGKAEVDYSKVEAAVQRALKSLVLRAGT